MPLTAVIFSNCLDLLFVFFVNEPVSARGFEVLEKILVIDRV